MAVKWANGKAHTFGKTDTEFFFDGMARADDYREIMIDFEDKW